MQDMLESESLALSTILNISIIRDQIMEQVTPVDVVNFVIGNGIKLSTKDMQRYLSIFECIIPNRRWMQTKIKKGYKFTVLSKKLLEAINTNRYNIRRRISMRDTYVLKSVTLLVNAVMIITMNGYTECTSSFMAESGLSYRNATDVFVSNSTSMKTQTTDSNTLNTAALCNHSNRVSIVIVCVVNCKDASKPFLLDASASSMLSEVPFTFQKPCWCLQKNDSTNNMTKLMNFIMTPDDISNSDPNSMILIDRHQHRISNMVDVYYIHL
ncbi:hypothetical protein LTR95_009941 [Oleoguttula sp. CCFEE 5521]